MPAEQRPCGAESKVAISILWISFISMDAVAQLLFKSAAVHLPEPSLSLQWLYVAATSIRLWEALACLGVVFVVWMLILRRMPLSTAFAITAATYVVVVAASRVLLGETIAGIQYLGIALIVIGVAMLRPAS